MKQHRIYINERQISYLLHRMEHYDKMSEKYEERLDAAKADGDEERAARNEKYMSEYIHLQEGFQNALDALGIYFTYVDGRYEIHIDHDEIVNPFGEVIE